MSETIQKGFTCPQCHRTSYNPKDLEFGYCGHCHQYTGEQAVLGSVCEQCGRVSPFHNRGCPVLVEHQQQVADRYGTTHPTFFPVGQFPVQAVPPSPSDPDFEAWATLRNAVASAPNLGGVDITRRQKLALYLWNLGYRLPRAVVVEAWEQAHEVFCPRGKFCSTHLRPGDRHLLASGSGDTDA